MPAGPPPTATFLWRIRVTVPRDAMAPFEEILEAHCMAVSAFKDNGHWRVEGFTGAEPDEKAFHELFTRAAKKAGIKTPKTDTQLVPPRDWVADNLADFPPVKIGRYFIHGSHFEAVPPGLIAV